MYIVPVPTCSIIHNEYRNAFVGTSFQSYSSYVLKVSRGNNISPDTVCRNHRLVFPTLNTLFHVITRYYNLILIPNRQISQKKTNKGAVKPFSINVTLFAC